MLQPRSAAGRHSLLAAPRFRRHLLSLLARLGKPNRNRLLAALHLASPAAWTAPGCAALVAAHLVPDVRSRASRISPRPLGPSFGHVTLPGSISSEKQYGPDGYKSEAGVKFLPEGDLQRACPADDRPLTRKAGSRSAPPAKASDGMKRYDLA